MVRGRISSNHGPRLTERETGLARVLEPRGIGKSQSNLARDQMERAIYAKPDV